MLLSTQELQLCRQLRDLPRKYGHRYTTAAKNDLLQALFLSLADGNEGNSRYFFPTGVPARSEEWSLRQAQGATEGAEYTEAARGQPCGHIFKSGEATYRCKTCTVDDTCVLCARCFDASHHEGHTVYVSITPGNSGCCDCGDAEAWIRPVNCNIHTAHPEFGSTAAGKAKQGSTLSSELLESIRITIARALDYFNDVFSCAPEQLRLPKTVESVKEDERLSRLSSKWYEGEDVFGDKTEFALVLWNDEKHTVHDVQHQVARACKMRLSVSLEKAHEVDDVGRSVVKYSSDLPELLRMAQKIEEIKLTVTVRSARDTFREQMCGTIIEWIHDIAGCSVGNDPHVLRRTICEEMLKAWRTGSEAHHKQIGKEGLYDHQFEDAKEEEARRRGRHFFRAVIQTVQAVQAESGNEGDEDDISDDDDETDDMDADGMDLDNPMEVDRDGDLDMDASDEPDDILEVSEATLAGYPAPPPPPPPARRRADQDLASVGSDDGDMADVGPSTALTEPVMTVPKTPRVRTRPLQPPKPPKYWLEAPPAYSRRTDVFIHEDLWQRVRLDFLILYDLRMWKQIRIDMRDVFISTVVTLPHFKRLLGLRFAGLYTALAQLYLIADREPDHSIINLSLQMLTTPSITAEIVERGNFLSNLMAILYTFVTSRQVGYPSEVNLLATLAFEAGAVTNRRMYHFFMDMKYLLGSELVQEKIRNEDRYLLQFLDLVKLHQGICPNVRAVGEHLEYETDAWISAAIITREMNKLCRQFSESFNGRQRDVPESIRRAIRHTTKVVIVNSMGSERRRFGQSEIKRETRFKHLDAFEFEDDGTGSERESHRIVDYVLEKEPMSFHHALHYTLSWLIDRGKSMTPEDLVGLLKFSSQELRQPPIPAKAQIPDRQPDDYLLALFDFPLRVCAWLAQMRAGMWVRNGITLRHQMSTYRGVTQRDVSFQRDLFLLQTAFAIMPPATILASMIDRFDLVDWVRGNHLARTGQDDHQFLDVAEDFIHLLIILLGDRTLLLPVEEEPQPQHIMMRRDIAHILCFKPLSFSELSTRLSDKSQDSDEFGELLKEMTTFRAPEGLSDSGTFELKEEFIEEIDPYVAQYSRNQREEAENIYKTYASKRSGKPVADVVFEPKIRQIHTGIFKDLSAVTRTPLFAQVVYYFLAYTLVTPIQTPTIPATRMEAFVHFILHLVLLAVIEDPGEADEMSGDQREGFVALAIAKEARNGFPGRTTILSLLHAVTEAEHFKACQPKARSIIRRLCEKRPRLYHSLVAKMGLNMGEVDRASPAPPSALDKELKKKQALERQARVMAQFKQQQSNFLENQSFDWGEDDFSDLSEDFHTPTEEQEKVWKYPAGTCILCQEETNDERLYGTFAMIAESRILRQTDVGDEDWVMEAVNTPASLDRSADAVRPFGVASQNRTQVQKVTSDGAVVITNRQGLGKGFPSTCTQRGPVATGCGHIMHFSCFEVYLAATHRRHNAQIARNHPERFDMKEFLCPLCKALGNSFLPIIWKGKTLSYPGVLEPELPFELWLSSQVAIQVSKLDKSPERVASERPAMAHAHRQEKMFFDYGSQEMITPLSSKLSDLTRPIPILPAPQQGSSHRFMPWPSFIPAEDPHISNESSSVDNPSLPLLELRKIYQRLRDTMKLNSLQTRYSYPSVPVLLESDLTFTDTLAKSLGFSISAVEISQRGVDSDVSLTLLDKIPNQSLIHLRVLSETVSSYIAVGGLHNNCANKTSQEFMDTQSRQLHQLFVGHPEITGLRTASLDVIGLDPLLTQDSFVFLAECSACLVPALHLDIHHVLRLCYLAEIVRVTIAFGICGGQTCLPPPNASAPEAVPAFERLCTSILFWCMKYEQTRSGDEHDESVDVNLGLAGSLGDPTAGALLALVSKYALAFLRKATILLHVRYGIDFPPSPCPDEPELDRLTTALRLPTLAQLFRSFTSSTEAASFTRHMVAGWIRHWTWAKRPGRVPPITVSHPAIFELVGLPKNYDTLTDEATRRRCPTTGKELTDPCVCLFCGEIFCSQGVCCMTADQKGGCHQHQAKCAGSVGVYINIRKCMVLFLNQGHGTWTVAPYLDRHGEVDPTLRRHHQLFLNQRRYDVLLRNVWLQHGIPSTIARRLEGDINNGGWETL